jgi:hypothetical protein
MIQVIAVRAALGRCRVRFRQQRTRITFAECSDVPGTDIATNSIAARQHRQAEMIFARSIDSSARVCVRSERLPTASTTVDRGPPQGCAGTRERSRAMFIT